MPLTIKYIKRTLELFTQMVDELSVEVLNTIPAGFNNNIAWNFGHAVVTVPALCYIRSAVKPTITIPYLRQYVKGSKPTDVVTREELEELKSFAEVILKQIEEDIVAGVFADFKPFATSTFVYDMDTVDEILTAALAHTGLHYGYALAIKKTLG
jgi:DinB superfamily